MGKADVTMRPLTKADTSAVVEMVLSPGGVGVSSSFNWPEEALAPEVKEQPGWGLWDSGRLAAFCLWREYEAWNEISVLASHPEFRRRGHMERLLQAAFDAHDHRLWRLEVHERNEGARALYQKLGFELLGRRTRYYKDGSDALVLERALP